MPRLTAQHYLELHAILQGQWLTNPRPFSYITAKQQWDIHAYFQPHRQWSDAGLLAYRKQVTIADPSLPHRAGRALKKLIENTRHMEALAVQASTSTDSKHHIGNMKPVAIYPLVKPEIDTHKIARALVGYANWKVRQSKD